MQPETDFTGSLSDDEIEQFHREGYLGPYRLCEPDEMEEIRQHIDDDVLTTAGPDYDHLEGENNTQDRHRDDRTVFELASHPAVIDRMADLYGRDLAIWATIFWVKEPGGAAIPWHQDMWFWNFQPSINLSAWLAIDDVTIDNSCVNIVPGTHKERIPHVDAPEEAAFSEMSDPDYFDEDDAVPMELEPGEFFLFNENTVHGSERNDSDMRRCGMAIRVIPPWVKMEFDDDEEPFRGRRSMLVRGEDRNEINESVDPPTDD